jgi:hypothetical protein
LAGSLCAVVHDVPSTLLPLFVCLRYASCYKDETGPRGYVREHVQAASLHDVGHPDYTATNFVSIYSNSTAKKAGM